MRHPPLFLQGLKRSCVLLVMLAWSAFASVDTIAPLGTIPTQAPIAATDAATQAVAPSPPSLPPAVEEVLKMVAAKVDVEVIKSFVESSPVAYELDADDVVYLKEKEVPDEIVAAMLRRGAELRAQAAQPAGEYAAPPTTGSSNYLQSPESYAATPTTGYPYYTYNYWDNWYPLTYSSSLYPYSYYPYYNSWGYGYPYGYYTPFYFSFYSGHSFGHHHHGFYAFRHKDSFPGHGFRHRDGWNRSGRDGDGLNRFRGDRSAAPRLAPSQRGFGGGPGQGGTGRQGLQANNLPRRSAPAAAVQQPTPRVPGTRNMSPLANPTLNTAQRRTFGTAPRVFNGNNNSVAPTRSRSVQNNSALRAGSTPLQNPAPTTMRQPVRPQIGTRSVSPLMNPGLNTAQRQTFATAPRVFNNPSVAPMRSRAFQNNPSFRVGTPFRGDAALRPGGFAGAGRGAGGALTPGGMSRGGSFGGLAGGRGGGVGGGGGGRGGGGSRSR